MNRLKSSDTIVNSTTVCLGF